MIEIRFKEKGKMGPYFGWALPLSRIVFVREDLPKWVRMSVIVHELYHLDDTAKNMIWREMKAFCAQLFVPLLGGIGALVMSLNPERVRYFWRRFIKRDPPGLHLDPKEE